jgi:hypothetical protein
MELAAGPFVKILSKVLGAGIDLFVEGWQVVDHEVVKIVDGGTHHLLEKFEVEKHTSFVKLFADQGNEDFVIMAMRVFALASVIAEVVAGRKAGFYSYFKHESGNPFDLSIAASGEVRVGWGRGGSLLRLYRFRRRTGLVAAFGAALSLGTAFSLFEERRENTSERNEQPHEKEPKPHGAPE